ncbi:MAG: aldo/keto reductase [Actinobacteria bacterium]|nr:aldo/keto reductase [Actinomycetota bacterium]
MDTVRLGKTNLEVSVAGLGCGGHSRLGQTHGATEAESIAVVQRALDLGINLIDTARAYGTEEIVGKAIKGRRHDVVLSTKALLDTEDSLTASLDKSLKRLGTDYVDVFFLHGVTLDQYQRIGPDCIAELLALRDAGKLRHLAISERFADDAGHAMLPIALADACWDVVMVGFSILNPSARTRVFPITTEQDVAVLVMFAVRKALSSPDELHKVLASVAHREDALDFLVDIVDAAYRFARHEPGTDVVLTGTGNVAHLESNVESINRRPLSGAYLARLETLFRNVDTLTGN